MIHCLHYFAVWPWYSFLPNTTKLVMDNQVYEMEINHLLYMDGLILYEKNHGELEELFSTANIFSNDIGMELGLDKCAKATFIRRRLTLTSEIKLNESTCIME